jgi:hypothetical protein
MASGAEARVGRGLSAGLKPCPFLEHNVFSPDDVRFHEHALPLHVYDVSMT